jgi:hypothetical protein
LSRLWKVVKNNKRRLQETTPDKWHTFYISPKTKVEPLALNDLLYTYHCGHYNNKFNLNEGPMRTLSIKPSDFIIYVTFYEWPIAKRLTTQFLMLQPWKMSINTPSICYCRSLSSWCTTNEVNLFSLHVRFHWYSCSISTTVFTFYWELLEYIYHFCSSSTFYG